MYITKWFYILILLSFILLLQNAHAAKSNQTTETKVLYFYIVGCHFYEMEIPYIDQVKEYWHDKVDWDSYDINEWPNRHFMDEYNVSETPQAVIECSNRSFRIIRTEGFIDNQSVFAYNINQTIYKCQTGEFEKELFIAKLVLFILFAFLTACLIHKYTVKRKKLRRRAKKH